MLTGPQPLPVRARPPLARWAVLALIGCLLLLAARQAALPHYRTPTNAGVIPAGAPTTRTPHEPAGLARAVPARAQNAQGSGVPLQVLIPAQHIDAPVAAEAVLADGTLGVPADPHVLGWWRYGAPVGAAAGTVVLDGHVDTAAAGPGALFHLAELPMGSAVTVRTSNGNAPYRVVARRVYDKSALPADVFDRKGPARLVLITCGGPFDSSTSHYRDNIVIYAVPDARSGPAL